LSWLTKAENEADKIQHGRSNRGERSSKAKLSRDQVRLIRKAYDDKSQSTSDIGAEFGINQSTVSAIGQRLKWRWLPEA
jgi:DNA-binding MarR family transcriptional regulator